MSSKPDSDDSLPDLSLGGPSPSESNPVSSGELDLRQIGPYKILQKIAEGGMGAVYMAEQSEPIKRRVALKVIKAGRDTDQIIARFEAERQALAMMEHINIARIFDAGTTDVGSPYFVMELVSGIPLTEYCDSNKLSIRERLELFVPVCRAVQHAHTKGIIHRDLKPSNVLVALYDGVPVPKVIDFGLAKATEHQLALTDRTMFTEFGQVVGTLQYMSPEQAEMNQLDIDTRTDVYSLGVMLYELLTGSTPLDDDTMKQQALLKVLELIRDSEPPRPSTRLSDSGNAIAGVSAQRQILPAKLQKILRGELDWIVMKSLEKDRSRRYDTANAFAADIDRYLSDEAVSARPPSTAYRASKFVRKNRGLVGSLATIGLLLVAGILGTGFGLIEANEKSAEAEREATRANDEAKRARTAEAEAKDNAEQTKAAMQVFVDSFRSIDPSMGANANMLAKDVLIRAQDSITDSKLNRGGKAQLQSALTQSLLGVGEFQSAVESAGAAVDLNRSLLGETHPETLRAQGRLATSYLRVGQVKQSLELQRQVSNGMASELGNDHPDTLRARVGLAMSYKEDGQVDKAIAILGEVQRARAAKNLTDPEQEIAVRHALASCYGRAGRTKDALRLNQELVEYRSQTFGSDDPRTLRSMNNLANDYRSDGQTDRAIQLEEKVLELRKSKLGEDHPETLTSINNLANSYQQASRWREALKMHQQALRLRREKLESGHPDVISSMTNVGLSHLRAGETDKAIQIDEEAVKVSTAELGPKHPATLLAMNALGAAYVKVRRVQDAAKLFEKIVKARRERNETGHPNYRVTLVNLAAAYSSDGRLTEAIKLNEEAIELMKVNPGPTHPDTLISITNLAAVYSRAGRVQDAIDLYESNIEAMMKHLAAGHMATLVSSANLANALLSDRQYTKATERFRQVLVLMESKLGKDHLTTLSTMINYARSARQAGNTDKAVEVGEELLRRMEAKSGPNHTDTAMAMEKLATNYQWANRLDEANALLERVLSFRSKALGEDNVATLNTLVDLDRLPEAVDQRVSTLKTVYDQRSKRSPNRWSTYRAQSLLGRAMLSQAVSDEAQEHLGNSYAGLQKTVDQIPPPLRKPILTAALDGLIELAKVNKNDADVKKWQAAKDALDADGR